MVHFTRLGLLIALLCSTAALRAQSLPDDFPTGVYIEPECFDFTGTDFFVGTDIRASQERYVAYEAPAPGMEPDTQFFRRSIDLSDLTGLADEPDALIPILNLLTINVYGRLRATESRASYLMVRVNEQDWFTFEDTLPVTEDFEWIAAPARLPKLRSGVNTIDIAILQQGTQLDKIFVTVGMDAPSGLGGEAINCGGFDFEPNVAPMAVARAEPDSGSAPLTVLLDGSDSFDDDGQIISYDWSWEGGGSASGPTPTATFTAAGTYSVSLTVTDDFRATDTDVVVVTVTEPDGGPAVSEFWLEAECAEVGSVWESVVTNQASRSLAVSATQTMRGMVPEDVPENRVRFTLENAAAGDYSLFARVNAPSGLSDSYYVRINDGEWYSWSRGFRQGQGYRWKRYPDGPVSLTAGTNIIDFAFREAGTELDKLHLNQTGVRPPVTSFGEPATNCGDLDMPTLALEAECGVRSGGWRPFNSPMASGDKAMLYVGVNRLDVPSDDVSDRALTFNFDVMEAGTYYGFLRLDAPNLGANSFWVRVDGGAWIKMWKETDGTQLLTDSFAWRTLADDGQTVAFDLAAGSHVLTVAHREPNTRLDKIILSTSTDLPDGLGAAATNCSRSQPINSFLTGPAEPALTTDAAATVVSVFPNPTSAELTLDLAGDYAGRIEVQITDFTGRQLRRLSFDKARGDLRRMLDVRNLAPGMYRLHLLEGDRSTVRSFVKL